jgi:predicted nuclease of predicted toxin-antitoxin system
MTLMRLKLDENLDVGLAVWLESLGHDAQTVRDEQMSGAPDDKVFGAAAAEDRCLVTLDLDFSDPIHFPPAAGTIVLRVPVPSMAMIRRLLQQAIAHAEDESPTGQIWIVEAGRIRVWESWDIK